MASDITAFLKLQSDAWLLTLKDRVADAILAGSVTVSFSNASQSGSQELVLPTDELANQLTTVLIDKSLVTGTKPARMTFARFAR
jgi:hypothetical protein